MLPSPHPSTKERRLILHRSLPDDFSRSTVGSPRCHSRKFNAARCSTGPDASRADHRRHHGILRPIRILVRCRKESDEEVPLRDSTSYPSPLLHWPGRRTLSTPIIRVLCGSSSPAPSRDGALPRPAQFRRWRNQSEVTRDPPLVGWNSLMSSLREFAFFLFLFFFFRRIWWDLIVSLFMLINL